MYSKEASMEPGYYWILDPCGDQIALVQGDMDSDALLSHLNRE